MGQEGTFGQANNQGQAVQQGSGASPNYQGRGQGGTVSNALPITQGLAGAAAQAQAQAQPQAQPQPKPQAQAQGACPASPPGLLPIEQCQGRTSNCWSVGQADVDCINNALCCFDGCANVCQGAGSVSPAQPPTPQRKPNPQRPKPQARPVQPA